MSFPRRLTPALAGTLAALGVQSFLVVALTLQYLRADLDWIAAPLSFYLIGPYSVWLIAAYFLLAASILLVGFGFHWGLSPQAQSGFALLLFGISALCVCTVALAHTDLPGAARLTPVGMLHNGAAILAFVCANLGMLLQAWCLRDDAYWQRHFRAAFALAVLTFVSLAVYALWHALPRGISEKFVVLLVVLWLLLASRWLMQTRSTPLEADLA